MCIYIYKSRLTISFRALYVEHGLLEHTVLEHRPCQGVEDDCPLKAGDFQGMCQFTYLTNGQ